MGNKSPGWHGSKRLHRRTLGVGALMVALALTFTTAIGSVAYAGDGRARTPEGELHALYIHGLGRAPDPAGWNHFLGMMNGDCRWNILRASYDILTSAEAANRWRTPENLVGAIYAALLDRAPDPGGFRTYVEMTRSRGFPSAVANVLASGEYKTRSNAICAGRPGPGAGMFHPDAALGLAKGLWDASKYLAAACGIEAVAAFAPIPSWKLEWRVVKHARTAAEAVKAVAGPCRAWWTVLNAIDYAWSVSYAGYVTFWRVDTTVKKDRWPPDECTTWIRIGTDPSRWNTYVAQYSCGVSIRWPF